jgi:hypothetical protein
MLSSAERKHTSGHLLKISASLFWHHDIVFARAFLALCDIQQHYVLPLNVISSPCPFVMRNIA